MAIGANVAGGARVAIGARIAGVVFALVLAWMALAANVENVAAQEPAVLVVLRDGQTLVSLYRDGRLMGLPDRSPEATRMVTDLLRTGNLPRPAALKGLAVSLPPASGAGSSVPTADETRPIAPIGTVVRDVRPVFRWRPQLHATGYRVTVRNERGTAVASSPLLPGTSWQCSQALAAGRAYSWTVDAELPSKPAAAHVPAEAIAVHFRVIDADAARDLDARLARAGRSNLLKGLAYTQAGVLDEAEAAFAALVADNAGSDRMRSLLDQVRAMRGAP